MATFQGRELRLKILVAGNTNVGKTALIRRYVNNTFMPENSTLEVDIKHKDTLLQDRKVKLTIWDTPGKRRFVELTKLAIRNSDAVIIVYDITKRQSFEDLDKWIQLVDLFAPEAEIILVGNKCEPDVKREVTYAEARTFAKNAKLNVIEVSVKLPQHVEEMFTEIIERAARKKGLNEVNDPESGDTETIQLRLDNAETPKKKSGCKCKK